MRRLNKREKRFIIGGAGTLAIILIVFVVVFPFLEAQQSVQADLDQQVTLLQKSMEMLGRGDQYQERLRQVDRSLAELEGRLMNAPSKQVAETRLLQLLNSLADENGVTIIRSNPVPERREGEYVWVGLQVHIDCGINELTSLLRSLSENQTFLVVDEFSLNIGRTRNAVPRLRPRIRVSGLVRLS